MTNSPASSIFSLISGALTAAQARERRSSQGFAPMALYVDAKYVYAATAATGVIVGTAGTV